MPRVIAAEPAGVSRWVNAAPGSASSTAKAAIHPVALIVEERGWTEPQVAQWLADLLTMLLSVRSADQKAG